MNFLTSLANLGKAAVEAADRRQQAAPKRGKGGPGCTPCAALAYARDNREMVAQYSARTPAKRRR